MLVRGRTGNVPVQNRKNYFVKIKVIALIINFGFKKSVGKRTAQKDTIIDITSDSQVNSNFPYRWSPASLTFNNYFYLFLY